MASNSDAIELKGCGEISLLGLGFTLLLCGGLMSFGDRMPIDQNTDPAIIDGFRRHDTMMGLILVAGLMITTVGLILVVRLFVSKSGAK